MKWAALFVAWAAAAPAKPAADWIKVSSANFELLTSVPEADARKTLVDFEQARAFFLREQPSLARSAPPAIVVGFGSLKEYRPYSPRARALAYYHRQPQGDFIVVGDMGFDRMRIAIHEYVHLLVQHAGLHIPLWLNEGMAEVYSTLEERGGKLALGTVQSDRVTALGGGDWMRLPVLIRVTEKSPEYNEDEKGTMFYAQSCLLAHMLMLGDGYKDRFPRFLESVASSGSTQTAFAEVYGKPMAEIEKDMM